MSYARFGSHSDVYVFLDVNGFYSCCACTIPEGERELQSKEKFYTTDDLIFHLDEHRKLGHKVPHRTYDRLREERDENDAWIEQVQNERTT